MCLCYLFPPCFLLLLHEKLLSTGFSYRPWDLFFKGQQIHALFLMNIICGKEATCPNYWCLHKLHSFFFFFFILAMQVRRYMLIQEYIQGGEVVYKVVKGIELINLTDCRILMCPKYPSQALERKKKKIFNPGRESYFHLIHVCMTRASNPKQRHKQPPPNPSIAHTI